MSKPCKILVIDDEPDIALFIKKALEDNGFDADAFSDPSLALSNFKAGQYDLVISDVRMPGMSGIQLVREIRKIDASVRVLFLSAFEIQEKEWQIIHPALDIDGFVEKPVDITRLVQQVSHLKTVNS